MLRVHLFTMQSGGWKCDNINCRHEEKYHDHIIGNNFTIKIGTICMAVYLSDKREVYCRDCIDILYRELKPVLDSRLWIFT